MDSAVVYLDESGDLGWKFDLPFRNGGSSRHLTISSIIVPSDQRHLPARFIKKIYNKNKWSTASEKKWALMLSEEKAEFQKRAFTFVNRNYNVFYQSITVYKPNVQDHIRHDGNKLYNYMIGLMLLERLKQFDAVDFVYDERSVKVKSGNSLPDYLQTKLWFEYNVPTKLKSCPRDSKSEVGLQFADMLSGCIQQHFEDKKSDGFNLLQNCINHRKLYFLQEHSSYVGVTA